MYEGFNLHSLPFLFIFLFYFFASFFILVKNRKSAVSRSFFIAGLSVAFWQLPYFIIYNLSDNLAILFWIKIAYFWLILIAPAFYQFIVSFLNLNKKRLVISFFALALALAFLGLPGTYIIKGVKKFPWGSLPAVGKAYIPFLIVWFIPIVLCFKYLYLESKRTESPYDKKRIKYLLYTLPIAFFSLIDILPYYGIDIYPLGFIPLILFGISTAYAIVRYRLLDIEIIFKKVSLIALGFAVSMSALYLITFYLQRSSYSLTGKNWIIFPILISLFTGVGLLRFISFVVHIEEDEFSKRFAYRSILKREAERISKAKNINELIVYLIRDFSASVNLDYVGICIFDNENRQFLLTRSITRTKKRQKLPANIIFSLDSPLIIELLKSKKPLLFSEIEYCIKNKAVSSSQGEFLALVAKDMKRLGAEIVLPSFCEAELLAIIALGDKLNPKEIITAEDLEIFMSISSNIARAIRGFMLQKEKIRLIVASQNIIINAIEAKDAYTRGHTERVARYTALIGKRLKETSYNFPYELPDLNWSAELHDVGKIGIPDSILFKPSPLSEEEWVKIKEHPVNGIKIISSVKEWLGEDICAGILQHHENYDGSGYPYGRKAEEIHLFARIIRVADAFDAMTTQRPYRPPLSKQEAMKELQKYKGIYFEPLLVDTLEESYNEREGKFYGD
jgi:HD-GYP domain-containing protein (c-di-GMP phosphodiesterase class II)